MKTLTKEQRQHMELAIANAKVAIAKMEKVCRSASARRTVMELQRADFRLYDALRYVRAMKMAIVEIMTA